MAKTPFIKEVDDRFEVLESSSALNLIFKIIQPDSGTSIAADAQADTLTITSPNNLLSVSGNASTDTLTLTVNQANFDHGTIGGLSDDDHTQYHTNARALTWLASRSTTDLPEGSNLYYTDERAQDAVGNILSDTATINFTYTDGTPLITADVIQSALDHGSIGGLTDDDHTQYALLAGRSGGQTINGGTGAAQSLDLRSTSHGTKGTISLGGVVFVDEANTRLGIGLTPSYGLQLQKTLTGASETILDRHYATIQPAASGNSYTGLQNSIAADTGSTSNISDLVAIDNLNFHSSEGTVTNLYGIRQQITNSSIGTPGTISNAYGLYNNLSHSAGTITNYYGLYLSSSGAGTVTNKYGIYQATAATKNYFAGTVGIGQTSPTALLHLKAGTATASTAPLKFTSGTNLTTPEVGAMEYDGTSLYFTPIGSRKEVALLGGSVTTNAVARFAGSSGFIEDTGVLINDSDLMTVAGLRSVSVAIADDSFTTIPLPGASTCLVSYVTNGNPGATVLSGIVIVRGNASTAPSSLVINDATNVGYRNTALNGTTGTDGQMTFGSDGSGVLYVENRLGASRTIRFTVIAN